MLSVTYNYRGLLCHYIALQEREQNKHKAMSPIHPLKTMWPIKMHLVHLKVLNCTFQIIPIPNKTTVTVGSISSD